MILRLEDGRMKAITAGDVVQTRPEDIKTDDKTGRKDKTMLLVIDCGNTNTVIGIFEGDAKVASWRMKTDPKKTADDHAVWLDHHMKRAEISRAMIKGAVIASVVPACQPQYCKLVDDHFGVDCFVIEGGDRATGLPSISTGRTGRCRQNCNAAGAAAYDLPAIVIDFGTATTFDLVDEKGPISVV